MSFPADGKQPRIGGQGWSSYLRLSLVGLALVCGAMLWQTPVAAWQGGPLVISLKSVAADKVEVQLGLDRLVSPDLPAPLRHVRVLCPQIHRDGSLFECPAARLSWSFRELALVDVPARMLWDGASGRIELQLSDWAWSGGRLQLRFQHEAGGWQLSLRASDLAFARLADLFAVLGLERSAWAWQNGTLDLDLTAEGQSGQLGRLYGEVEIRDLAFAAESHGLFAENLVLPVQFDYQGDGGAFQLTASLTQGALLSDWIYLDASQVAATLSAVGKYPKRAGPIRFERLRFAQQGLVELLGSLSLRDQSGAIEQLDLSLDCPSLGDWFAQSLQPVASQWGLEQARLQGSLQAKMAWRGSRNFNLRVDLTDLSAMDHADNPALAVSGLDARISWNDATQAAASSLLRADEIRLFGNLPFTDLELPLQLQGNRLQVASAASARLFDGRLLVDHLHAEVGDDGGLSLDLDAVLTPVSLARLTDAFGWPPLQGQVSGVIPTLRYRGDTLSVGGNLLVRAFDGRVLIRSLQLSDPFGVVPVLSGDVELQDLDLEPLTRSFSFGRITGRLEGQVRGLRMEAWRPVAFDAWLATPEQDDSSHRISQRAVDHISSLGGAGIGNALSRTMLNWFEEFRYRKLGIRCRLEAGVCQMDGVEPAPQGYYLVVGSGLPQINIVGFNRQADWDVLLEQLTNLDQEEAPRIETR